MKIEQQEISLVQVMLTYLCNLNCSYCYQDFSKDVGEKKMSVETFKKILGMFSGKEIDLNLFGGEPLLNREIIDYLLEDETQLPTNIKILSINTNGTLLDERIVKLYEKYKDIIYIDLSLDGKQNTHDEYRKTHSGKASYDAIIEKLHLFPQKDRFRINFCVSPYSAAHLYDAIISLQSLGFHKIKTMFLYEMLWTSQDLKSLITECIKLKSLQGKIHLSMFQHYEESPTECRDDFLQSFTFLPSGALIPCPVWISKQSSKVPEVSPIFISKYEEKIPYVEDKIFADSQLVNIIKSSAICESIQGNRFASNKVKIQAICKKIFANS